MPIYEYQCRSCGRRSEEFQRMSDPPLTECAECGGELKKLISAPAVQFKGSGWYVTDYAKSGGKKTGDSAAGDGGSSGDGSGGGKESKGDGGATESKGDGGDAKKDTSSGSGSAAKTSTPASSGGGSGSKASGD